MKISIATHGGWGGRFAAPISVDTATMPPELAGEAARLAAAAEAAHASGKPGAAPPSHAPEAQTYTITVEEEGRSRTLKASDVGDPHLTALVDWVKRQS
jgi:hypothetical protein